jgi:hypothetical protein
LFHLLIDGRAHWFNSQSVEEPIVSSTNPRKSQLVHLSISGRAYWFIHQLAEKSIGSSPSRGRTWKCEEYGKLNHLITSSELWQSSGSKGILFQRCSKILYSSFNSKSATVHESVNHECYKSAGKIYKIMPHFLYYLSMVV